VVLLNRIYTRTGDGGRTRLVTGETVSKSSPRVAAYGETDELNAVLGLARLELKAEPELDAILARAQNDLFDLGADLATPAGPEDRSDLRVASVQVARLEAEIDALNAELEPLRSFILPGGSRASAVLHLARTVCRRAERAASAFVDAEDGPGVHAEAVRYLNRLSDLLFVAARWANDRGRGDVLWVPAANR
jgi:cob(I)alamin adenosyltransferase